MKKALIIGGGPAGLTAAWELLQRTDIVPYVFERAPIVGGIASTHQHEGNRLDLGGHRFFSKSDRVLDWWFSFVPPEPAAAGAAITYQRSTRALTDTPLPDDPQRVMLLRDRQSRIFHAGKLFSYPLQLDADTLAKLGARRTARIGLSYLHATLRPTRAEHNLEQFFVNRFGRELYATFFESYTEKVWGRHPTQISAEWGAQRIKGLDVRKALLQAARRRLGARGDLADKDQETSLIEQFLYPRLGPGQLWEAVAEAVVERGGRLFTQHDVVGLRMNGTRVEAVRVENQRTGKQRTFRGDHVFSTTSVPELVRAMDTPPPAAIEQVVDGLCFRDFLVVGLLVDRLELSGMHDNWVYIQEPGVKMGRLQIFNNWSPAMVADPSKVWLGLEYFCSRGDALWTSTDAELIALGTQELSQMGIIEARRVRTGTVVRVPRSYPAYFGTYQRFGEVRRWTDGIDNLYLIGRNGMHRYNNQDHSMLAAMTAVDNIVAGRRSRDNIWSVNAEEDYHEER